MSQMLSGGATSAQLGGTPGPSNAPWTSATGPEPGDLSLQIPQAATQEAADTQHNPATAAANGMGIMSGFANFLGDTQQEREKNAKVFAAMVKDVGSIGKSITDSTLMQRMMKAQMQRPMAIMSGGSPAGGIAAIPRSFDPSEAAASMNRAGFK